MPRPIEFDQRKFEQLVLWFTELADQTRDERFGLTKLNKLLYFSDFKAYGALGASITGATYIKMPRGPVAQELLAELNRMDDQGLIERRVRPYFNYRQKRVEPVKNTDGSLLVRPDLTVFSEDEKAIVKQVFADLFRLNAVQVSELSHLETGWQLAEDREVIPYTSVYISNRRPTDAEVTFAEKHADDDEWPKPALEGWSAQ